MKSLVPERGVRVEGEDVGEKEGVCNGWEERYELQSRRERRDGNEEGESETGVV